MSTDETGRDWPQVTEWIVNGEVFRDINDAENYADLLEQAGTPITLQIRSAEP